MDCPHCYERVFPSPDGVCPACRRNINEKSSQSADFALVTLIQEEPLPTVCIGCGTPTQNRHTIRIQRGGDADARLAGCLLGSFSSLFKLIYHTEGPVVMLAVPACAACESRGMQQPRHVDFDNSRITLLVHNAFKAELAALRTKRV